MPFIRDLSDSFDYCLMPGLELLYPRLIYPTDSINVMSVIRDLSDSFDYCECQAWMSYYYIRDLYVRLIRLMPCLLSETYPTHSIIIVNARPGRVITTHPRLLYPTDSINAMHVIRDLSDSFDYCECQAWSYYIREFYIRLIRLIACLLSETYPTHSIIDY